jgi:hypothetical protein
MVADGGLGTATAIGSAANISLRLFQIIYEFKAVGQQTRDLLESTTHVSSTLERAETMRRQKSAFLTADERDWIDNIIIDTKRCLKSVAALVEPARVDMQIKSGRVGFLNKGRFVFRDSPKVANNLARLGLAHQSLNTAMGVLCSKGSYQQPLNDINRRRFIWQSSCEKDQPIQRGELQSDGGEKSSPVCSQSQLPVLVAEIQSPDARSTTIEISLESSVEIHQDITHVSSNIMPEHSEVLEMADHDNSELSLNSQGLEARSLIYRSKGRAWLESRSRELY